MPKNPSRKLPLQQHSLATVLFFKGLAIFSIVEAFFLVNSFNGFNISKSVGGCYYFFFFQTVCYCLSKSIKALPRSRFNFQNWSWTPGQHSAHFPSSALPGIAHPIIVLLYTLFINFFNSPPPLVFFFGSIYLNVMFFLSIHSFSLIFIFYIPFIDITAISLTCFP